MGKIQSQGSSEQVQQATQLFRQAKEHAAELKMKPLLAHCHNGLGHVYINEGKASEARSELETAMDLYRSMDMDFWLPQVRSTFKEIK